MFAGFQVGKQAHFFQRVARHGVRLVNQQNDTSAFSVAQNELGVKGVDSGRGAVGRHAQVVSDRIENLVAGKRRIGQIDGVHIVGQFIQQHSAQHRLAAADFADDGDDAFLRGKRVAQGFEQRAAARPGEEKMRIRRNRERGLIESEMLDVE